MLMTLFLTFKNLMIFRWFGPIYLYRAVVPVSYSTLVLNDLKEKEKSTEKNFNCLMFTRLFGTNLCLKLKKLSSPLRVLASEAAEHNMNIYKVLVYENWIKLVFLAWKLVLAYELKYFHKKVSLKWPKKLFGVFTRNWTRDPHVTKWLCRPLGHRDLTIVKCWKWYK